MIQICKFNKVTDIVATNPTLGVDLKGAIRNGVVKDTSATVFYNQQKELSDVGTRVRDEFDPVLMAGTIRYYREKRKEKPEKEDK